MKLIKLVVILGCFVASVVYAAPRVESAGEILIFPANAQKGFNWGYALYLPQTMDTTQKLPILLTMNNEDISDSSEKLEEAVRVQLRRNYSEYGIADGVGVPLLMPLVLQGTNGQHTHQLNRAVLKIKDGPLTRLDLQVLAMLEDARQQLQAKGIRTHKKFLVAGFSSAGVFAWNWTMLHPQRVLAAVVGGTQNVMLPLREWKNNELIYPVGVADFEAFTGKPFQLSAWRKVPVLLLNGGEDYNDPRPYNSVYGDEERIVFNQLYGVGNIQHTWKQEQQFLTGLAPNVQFHTYPHMGHEAVWQDEIDFLKQHIAGGPLRPIVLTDTSDLPALLPVAVKQLYFGLQAPITQDREYLAPTDLILQTAKEAPYWIRYKTNCRLAVLADKEVILPEIGCQGMFDSDKDESFLQVHLSGESITRLKQTGKHTFSVQSHEPDILYIPADLTFTIP